MCTICNGFCLNVRFSFVRPDRESRVVCETTLKVRTILFHSSTLNIIPLPLACALCRVIPAPRMLCISFCVACAFKTQIIVCRPAESQRPEGANAVSPQCTAYYQDLHQSPPGSALGATMLTDITLDNHGANDAIQQSSHHRLRHHLLGTATRSRQGLCREIHRQGYREEPTSSGGRRWEEVRLG